MHLLKRCNGLNQPNYVIFAGGGGEDRSGIPNALVISLFDSASNSLSDHPVRHAQGVHNVAGEKDLSAFMFEELFDAHLTPLGWEQVGSP
ncbi:hypothetical protein HanLR1_Chr05g0185011 [Helianthus annuus]|nr:hypothetical protein HanLR1_Chr05g0185011 [Helianthus annuus]